MKTIKEYEIDTRYVDAPISKGKTIMTFVTKEDVLELIAKLALCPYCKNQLNAEFKIKLKR